VASEDLAGDSYESLTVADFMDRIRVLIVDDHALVRRGLSEVLGDASTLEVVGEARDGDEGVRTAAALKPDVVLMDLHMPVCDGVEATRRLQSELPEIKVLLLTVSEREDDLLSAIQAGARGYMLKNEEPDTIIQAIQYVSLGGIIASPEMAGKLARVLEAGGQHDVMAIATPREADREPAAVEGVTVAEPEDGSAEDEDADLEVDGGQSAEPGAADTPQPQVETDSPGGADIAADDGVEREAEIVIAPPLEPRTVLRLQSWLQESARATITGINPSLISDTVLHLTIGQQVPLIQMLTEQDDVEQATEERAAEGTEAFERPNAGEIVPLRIRVVLRDG